MQACNYICKALPLQDHQLALKKGVTRRDPYFGLAFKSHPPSLADSLHPVTGSHVPLKVI